MTADITRREKPTDAKVVGTGSRRAVITMTNGEWRQHANTATTSGRKSNKAEHWFNRHGSSDDSDGEETHHYAHLAFVNDAFPGVYRERKEDFYNDVGRYLSLRIQDQIPVNLENHPTRLKMSTHLKYHAKEATLGLLCMARIRPLKDIPFPTSFITAVMDTYPRLMIQIPDMYTNTCMPRGAVIITVNEAVWEGLLHHEYILWGRLGCI